MGRRIVEDKYKNKYYNRDNWIISSDEEERYKQIRERLKEIGALRPVKSLREEGR